MQLIELTHRHKYLYVRAHSGEAEAYDKSNNNKVKRNLKIVNNLRIWQAAIFAPIQCDFIQHVETVCICIYLSHIFICEM